MKIPNWNIAGDCRQGSVRAPYGGRIPIIRLLPFPTNFLLIDAPEIAPPAAAMHLWVHPGALIGEFCLETWVKRRIRQ